MQGIKLVTFDATNTFLRFKIPPWKYYGNVARHYGFMGNEKKLRDQMKESFIKMEKNHPNFGKTDFSWENWWRELVRLSFNGLLPAEADVKNMANQLIEEYRTGKCWTIANGSQQLLDFLRYQGKCVGVLSNFDPRLTEILRKFNFHNNFDFIAISYEVGYAKPDRRIFESAIKMSNLSPRPSECLHIGDDVEKDYKAARDAGWKSLLVTTLESNHVFHGHVFKNVAELAEAIRNDTVKL